MSDRLAVFNHGRIEQIGAPAQVYEAPKSSFVAGFVGTSNIIEGALAQRLSGQAGRFSLRPERDPPRRSQCATTRLDYGRRCRA